MRKGGGQTIEVGSEEWGKKKSHRTKMWHFELEVEAQPQSSRKSMGKCNLYGLAPSR